MDLSLSADQEIFRENVRRYCREEFANKNRPEGRLPFSREHWSAYAQFGWLGLLLPEDVGGVDGSIIEVAIILEEFGRTLVAEPYLSCAVLAAQVMNRASNPEQRRTLLAPMIRGELLVSLAHSESQGRGDTAFVETVAYRHPNGDYVLCGNKAVVLNGSFADKFIVSARLAGPSSNAQELALFVVDKDAPGLARRGYYTIDGRDAAEVTLENVVVGIDAILTAGDSALLAIEEATQYAITGLCAEAVGAMDNVVKVTAEHLKTRRAYGTTLNRFQALQHRLADMLAEVELSRSLLYCTFAAFSTGDRDARKRAVSAAKSFIGRSAKFVAANGVQLHGAQGLADDYLIGRHFKQLTVAEALFGSSEFHLQQYSRLSGIRAAAPKHDSMTATQSECVLVQAGATGG